MLVQEESLHFFKIDDFTGVLRVHLTDFTHDSLGMDHFVVWRDPFVTGCHFEYGGRITNGHEEFYRWTRQLIIVEPSLEK